MDTSKIWLNYDENTYRQNTRCLSVNTILAGKYLVGPVLGQGGFGITYQGYDLNMETRIAIKEYFPVELVSRDTTTMHGDHVLSLGGEKSVTYKRGLQKYVAEAQNVSRFSEMPGVVSVKDFFYENKTAYIVMEYIEGESLKDYLKENGGRLAEEEALAILKPVIQALIEVHKAGIIHRDISPDNIMLTFEAEGETDGSGNGASVGAGRKAATGEPARAERAAATGAGRAATTGEPAGAGRAATTGEPAGAESAVATGTSAGAERAVIVGTPAGRIRSVKLIDFGAARMTAKNDQKSLTIILKHGYAPEEQYRTHGEQGPWTDVYAVCAVLYRMLTDETPVPAMDRLFSDELKPLEAFGIKVSKQTADTVLKGLAVKKENRISSMEELYGALYEGNVISGRGRSTYGGTGTWGGVGTCGRAGTRGRTGKHAAVSRAGDISAASRPAAHRKTTVMVAAALAAAAVFAAGFGILKGSSSERRTPGGKTGAATADAGNVSDLPETASADAAGAKTTGAKAAETDATGADATGTDATGTDAAGTDMAGAGAFSEEAGADQEAAVELVLGSGEEALGEQIVFPRLENMLAAGAKHFLSLRDDGTVRAIGDNDSGQCEVTGWTHVARVYAQENVSAGLRTDGTVLAAGNVGESDVASWNGIVDLAVGLNHILGLREDGTVVSAGNNSYGQCEVGDWTEIERIYAFRGFSVGVTREGTVKIAGTLEISGVTQGQEEMLERVKGWKNIQTVTWADYNSGVLIGVRRDGTVCVEGAEESSIRTFSYLKELKNVAQVVEGNGIAVRFQDGTVTRRRWEGEGERDDVSWENIAVIAGNSWELIGLRSDGTIAAAPLEWAGGKAPGELLSVTDAKAAVWGEQHLAILRENGTVVSAGNVFVQKACETDGWSNIAAIDAYDSGTLGLTADGRVVKTGYQGVSSSSSETIPDIFAQAAKLDSELASWSGNKQILCSSELVAALKEDGTVTAMGHSNNFRTTDYRTGETKSETTQTQDWTDIVQLAYSGTKGLIGLREDGTVLTTGKVSLSSGKRLVEGGTLPEWEALDDIASIWGNQSAVAAIRKDGTVVYLVEGDEANGQNNVTGWENMKQISIGAHHTVGLREDGTVLATGSNANGQCEVSDWENIVSVAAGPAATIGITGDGKVLMAGVFPDDYEAMEEWGAVTLPEE